MGVVNSGVILCAEHHARSDLWTVDPATINE